MALCALLAALPRGGFATPQAPSGVASDAVWSLPQAVEQALREDPQVLAAMAAQAAAQANVKRLRSRLWPTLQLQADVGHSDELEYLVPVQRRTGQSSVALIWNLYSGGANQAEWVAAEWEWQAAQLDLRRAQEEVAARIAKAWALLVQQVQLERLSDRHVAYVSRLTQKMQLQLVEGKISEVDGLQGSLAGFQVQMTAPEIRSARLAAQRQLQVLLGRSVGEIEAFALPLAANDEHLDVSGNVTLRAAQARAAAQQARVVNLASALAPSLDLSVRRTLDNRTDPPNSIQSNRSWSVTLNWQIPLGGEPLHQHEQSLQRAIAADFDAQHTARQIQTELAASYANVQGLRLTLRMIDTYVEQAQKVMDASTLLFESGRRNLQQLIQISEVHNEVLRKRVTDQAQMQQTLIQLYSLRGELVRTLVGQ